MKKKNCREDLNLVIKMQNFMLIFEFVENVFNLKRRDLGVFYLSVLFAKFLGCFNFFQVFFLLLFQGVRNQRQTFAPDLNFCREKKLLLGLILASFANFEA